jgi:GNAT superfamily N-acetyltransferase
MGVQVLQATGRWDDFASLMVPRKPGAGGCVCVVRPGFRRRGLMHALLEGAVGHAHAMGATVLEGYPVDPGSARVDQTSGYVGTVALFEAHGFSRICQTTGRRGGNPRWLVRRELS